MYMASTPSQKMHGHGWYQSAHTVAYMMAHTTGISMEQACGVIAALSPACPWERNILDAWALCKGNDSHAFTTYGPNIEKGRRILAGESPLDVLGGNKVRAFYSLLLNPADSTTVCVDRHAVKACTRRFWWGDKEPQQFLRSQYGRCANAYRHVAAVCGVLPHQVQATCWIVQRGL